MVDIKLAAPDKLTLTIGDQARTGHLVTKNGALQVVVAGMTPSTMTLVESGNGNPFEFTSVTVNAASVTLIGTIDLQSLLGL